MNPESLLGAWPPPAFSQYGTHSLSEEFWVSPPCSHTCSGPLTLTPLFLISHLASSSIHPLAGFRCPHPASNLSPDLVDDKFDFSDLAEVLWTPPVALSSPGNALQSTSWLVLLPGNWIHPFFSTLRYQPSFLLISPMLMKYL